jgi:predicted nucleic-acid-binding protein
MLGVDTNVLVRAVLDDHPQESALAKQLLRNLAKDRKLFISSYALLEMVWVLKVKGHTRRPIYEAVLDLLDSPGIVVGNREIIINALERYINGKADFGDHLILAEGKGYEVLSLASFDKTFCKEAPECQHPSNYLSKKGS